MGKSTKSQKPSRARHGVSMAWVCVLVVAAVCITAGVCAVYLPDRTPALLQQAKEVTLAPVETQEWSETRQITLTPTFSAERTLTSNSSGMVTADWSASGLESGKAAFAVDGRPVMALATSQPLWRDLHYYDTGEDVRALNDELVRLGYPADANSATYSWNTGNAWGKLLASAGAAGAADGSLSIADVLWIPEGSVSVSGWSASLGAQVMAGSQLATVPGVLQKLTIGGASVGNADRTVTLYGLSATLPAGQTEITDRAFLDALSASQSWKSQSADSLLAGVSGSISTGDSTHVLRVPAAAVYGMDETGTNGCIIVDGKTVHVSIAGAQMGVSLVTATDGSDIDAMHNVTVGSALRSATCE
ncbi:hypothetical protein [Pseudoscardovia suis]|nr:hypothetical protein [Pseudoscardovia suis]